jgi:hypothetical protein
MLFDRLEKKFNKKKQFTSSLSMKILHILQFQHPFGVAIGCSLAIACVVILFLYEAYRRHGLSQKYKVCPRCKGKVSRKKVKVPLKPDYSGGLLKRLLSHLDCLCQNQAICCEIGCPHKYQGGKKKGQNIPYVESEYIRSFGFRSRLFRLRELLNISRDRQEDLIKNFFVRTVLNDRKPKDQKSFFKGPPPLSVTPLDEKVLHPSGVRGK